MSEQDPAHVYLVADPSAAPAWAATDEGRQMLTPLAERDALRQTHAGLLEAIEALPPQSAIGRRRDARARAIAAKARLEETLASITAIDEAAEANTVEAIRASLAAAQRVVDMTAAEAAALVRLAELASVEQQIEHARAHYEEAAHIGAATVRGRVVFTYTFTRPAISIGGDPHLRRLAVARLIVHAVDAGGFIAVHQTRRRLSERRCDAWRGRLERAAEGWSGAGHHEARVTVAEFVDHADDAARWIARIEAPMNLHGLLAHVDGWLAQPGRPHGPNDEVSLPFLLRKALIEQGFEVPGVAVHGGGAPTTRSI